MTIEELKALKVSSNKEEAGKVLWSVLHKHALQNEYNSEWLLAFTNKVPCGACRGSFAVYPKPQKDDNFFEWTVKVHNQVNLKIGKKPMSFSEARDLWTR